METTLLFIGNSPNKAWEGCTHTPGVSFAATKKKKKVLLFKNNPSSSKCTVHKGTRNKDSRDSLNIFINYINIIELPSEALFLTTTAHLPGPLK